MHSQVLVLDDSLGPLGTNRSHELIHELSSLLELNARPPQTKVEGVLTQALVICSHAVLVSHNATSKAQMRWPAVAVVATVTTVWG